MGDGPGAHLVGPGRTVSAPPATAAPRPRYRGVSHEVAAAVFPVLGAVLVVAAHGAAAKVATVVYTVGISAMYTVSACYHRGSWSPAAKRRMRRLDHSTILVGIAATYTPVAAIGLDQSTGRLLLVAVWSLAVTGVVVRNLWLTAPSWVVATVYVAVGWVAVGVAPALVHHLGAPTLALVVTGGATYTLGAVVYSRKRPDPAPTVFGYHEVFHALVVGAGIMFYAAVATVVVHG